MLFDLSRHPLFEPWADPVSGIVSYVLRERVAPVQQGFYFVNSGIDADERWLWFYCGFPPSPYHTLGVVCLDPDRPEIRHYPGTSFQAESPLVDPAGGGVYFCSNASVWRQPLDPREPAVAICTLDRAYMKGRYLERLATHLSLSADGRMFLLDGHLGTLWFVATGDRFTGEVKVLKEFTRHMNHGQFSPVDPTLFTLAQDWWHDATSGQWFGGDQRIWLMNTMQTRFEALQPTQWNGHNAEPCHEWWSKDGRVCWVDYVKGVFSCDAQTRELRHVWKRPLCHAHSHPAGRFWVADQSPYAWKKQPCEVSLFDERLQLQAAIATGLPSPPIERSPLHIDPHPHFSPRGNFVTYTTTVRGRVDVAVTPLAGAARRIKAVGRPVPTLAGS